MDLDKPYFLAEVVPRDAHGFGQVAVTRDDDGAVVLVQMGVVHEVNGQVHVGSLLLGLPRD